MAFNNKIEETEMTACKYWDCGWCYAPNYLKTNAINSTCVNPYKCPISPLSEPVQYETPMTEIEEVKAQIKVLQSKLSFLEELEKTKSPVEEAFKDAYGKYPVKDVSEDLTPLDNWNVISWDAFQKGYNAAYEEKVSQEPEEEPEELKTLHQLFHETVWIVPDCDEFCEIVKEWMSQYTHNVMTGEYLKGYEECLTVLGENLK